MLKEELEIKGFCNRLELAKTKNKLLSLHKQVIQQKVEFHNDLLKDIKACSGQIREYL